MIDLEKLRNHDLTGAEAADEIERLRAQRDAMLAALQEADRLYSNNTLIGSEEQADECGRWIEQTRTAIKEAGV